MKRILWIPLLLIVLGCEDTETIPWEARQYTGRECENCPRVTIDIPEGPKENRLAQRVQRGLSEEIIHWLDYAEENKASTIEEAMESFGDGYRDLIKSFPDETAAWEARIEGLVLHESSSVLSISLDAYIYTGGAHGYSGRRYLNFDVGQAQELSQDALFSNRSAFGKIAETAFRKAKDIPMGSAINSTGFMFEENRFHLPENIGFTPEGVVLHYNPYEVASYADGAIEITIPYKQAAPFISKRLRPLATEVP